MYEHYASNNQSRKKQVLTGGEIAGIVLGSVAILLIIILLIFRCKLFY